MKIEANLSELSDKNLALFFIQATSYYKVKVFRRGRKEFAISKVDELETEMFTRSQNYWKNRVQEIVEKALEATPHQKVKHLYHEN